MQIYGPSYIHAPHSANAPHNARGSQSIGAANTPAKISDQLDISTAGLMADRLSEIPDIRQDKVDALRAAIAGGTYDTDEKMGMALDRLLDEIG